MKVTLRISDTAGKQVNAGPVDSGLRPTTPGSPTSWTPQASGICHIGGLNGANLIGTVLPDQVGSTIVDLAGLDHAGGDTKVGSFEVEVLPDELDHYEPFIIP